MTLKSIALLAATAALAAFAVPLAAERIADSAEDIRPVLLGSTVPDTVLADLDGSPVRLREAVAGRLTALVFYRGGWCPYCNLQLADLRHISADLEALGFTLVAITPDQPSELRKTVDKNELDYQLLSDTGAATMRGFGIAFRVDAPTTRRYQDYGIDLDAASGDSHHALPVPAVFLIDAQGVVRFSYVDPDYTRRTPAAVILAAARAVREQSDKLQR